MECMLIVGYSFTNADTYHQLPLNAAEPSTGVCFDKACVTAKLQTRIAGIRNQLGGTFDPGNYTYGQLREMIESKLSDEYSLGETSKTIYYYDENGRLICVTTQALLDEGVAMTATIESSVGDIHAEFTAGWRIAH